MLVFAAALETRRGGFAPETVDRLLEQLRGQLGDADDAPDRRTIPGKEKRPDAPTPETGQAYARSVEQTEAERALVARELEELQSRRQVQREVQGLDRRDVVALLDDVFARIQGGLDADDLEKTKAALGGLVHRIELEPGAETLRICYQVEPLTGLNLASPSVARSRHDLAQRANWQAALAVKPPRQERRRKLRT